MIKAIKKELKVLCECDLPLPQMMKSIRRRRAEKAFSGDDAIVGELLVCFSPRRFEWSALFMQVLI